MDIKQRRQKIPFLISFLILSAWMLLSGIYFPEERFTERWPRSKVITAGVVCAICSLLWYFFGSIDWTTWNRIKKSVKHKNANENEPHDDQ